MGRQSLDFFQKPKLFSLCSKGLFIDFFKIHFVQFQAAHGCTVRFLSKMEKICILILGKIDNMEFLYKASPMGELLDADEKNGIVKGYGSYFDNKDSDADIIRRGAYQKTIKENGGAMKRDLCSVNDVL